VVIEEDGLQETSGAEKRYGSGGRVECPMSNAAGRRRRPPQKAAATKPTPLYGAMEEGQCSVASGRGCRGRKRKRKAPT
jgi:hypothetical protein